MWDEGGEGGGCSTLYPYNCNKLKYIMFTEWFFLYYVCNLKKYCKNNITILEYMLGIQFLQWLKKKPTKSLIIHLTVLISCAVYICCSISRIEVHLNWFSNELIKLKPKYTKRCGCPPRSDLSTKQGTPTPNCPWTAEVYTQTVI